MVKRLSLLVLACLALLITVSDVSATVGTAKATGKSVTSAKAAKSQPADLSKKASVKAPDTAGNAKKSSKTAKSHPPDKAGTADSAKKSSQKQKAQASGKSQSKNSQSRFSNSKALNSRGYMKDKRDPSTFPAHRQDFAGTPRSALAVLSTIPVDGELASFFGMRHLRGISKRARMHGAIDINAPHGTPVFAAGPGVVTFTGRWGAYGITVELDHGNGLITRYAHLDKYVVAQGATVAAGTQIGNVGKTGNALNMHLHFETLVNGTKVDPMLADMWRHTVAEKGVIVGKGTTLVTLRTDGR